MVLDLPYRKALSATETETKLQYAKILAVVIERRLIAYTQATLNLLGQLARVLYIPRTSMKTEQNVQLLHRPT